MLVDLDCGDDYPVWSIDKRPLPDESHCLVEVPDELVERYERAEVEHREAQSLLQKIADNHTNRP